MMTPPLPPEILAQLLRAFQAAQAQQGPMQPMPAAPMAPGIGAPNPGFSLAPPTQGFALAPAEGPLGENAQLGWGTAPPMQYPSPTSGIGTAVSHTIAPKPKPKAPQRRGQGDFNRALHPSQNVAGNASAPGRPPDRGPVRSGPQGSHIIRALSGDLGSGKLGPARRSTTIDPGFARRPTAAEAAAIARYRRAHRYDPHPV